MADKAYSVSDSVRWCVRPRQPDVERELSEATGISRVTAALLAGRGITSPKQVEAYFSPSSSQLHDPADLPDIGVAVALVNEAIDQRQTVLVHGDYDVDGLTATALLVRFLSKLGCNVQHFIPHRIHDHYGLNTGAVERAINEGASLVIAVDCGVRDHEAVERACEMGAAVIVLDHHEPGEELPPADAIVDPKVAHSTYANRELASAGLALQLARAVAKARDIDVAFVERAFLDLAALGTIADVAPLIGENRALAAMGLERLAKTKKTGLRTLMNLCKVNGAVKASDVGFRLAPRMNAAGRLADPGPALDLLLTADQDEANRTSMYLDGVNRQRQQEQQSIYDDVRLMIERDVELDDTPVIVLASDRWHVGVVGIAASKVVSMYGRPAILMVGDGGVYRGSGRSIPEFNLAAGLDRCADVLERHGGHAMAVGAQVKRENLELLRERLCAVANETLDIMSLEASIEIDAEVQLSEVTHQLTEEMATMDPFGNGNPEPSLAVKGARVADKMLVGRDGTHLKLWVTDETHTYECIGFGMSRDYQWLRDSERVDLCFSPEINEYQGSRTLQLRLKALRPAEGGPSA
ncbi:MAG TPA: single-stranded-DNA-specific exonuclease RecJ [Armatimonadota bacterium]|nr:single-stranded-DNA-specific exonuclease RecJ [Armatimonadota bacterium]